MNETDFFESGFREFDKLLKELADKVSTEKMQKAIEEGAKTLVSDIKRLPKPRSEITQGGYTHLLDTVGYKRNRDEIEVGWSKYYGPMLESGTRKMGAQSHLRSTFNKNKDKYYKAMIKEIWR